MYLSDNEFQSQFQNLTLPASEFDHKGHLRIAFIYLQQNELPAAIKKVCAGIQKYATSLGATEKFQHTLTEATVRIMAERMRLQSTQNFAQFKLQNLDILEDLRSVLQKYYHLQTLFSDTARQHFVAPDKQAIEALCD